MPPRILRLSAWLGQSGLRPTDVIETLAATIGPAAVPSVVRALPKEPRGPYALAVAEFVSQNPDSQDLLGDAREWAVRCVAAGPPAGSVATLFGLGLDVEDLPEMNRDAVLTLTREVQAEYHPSAEKVLHWLDGIEILSRIDLLGLTAVEGAVRGPGWYRCWLRFSIAVARRFAERAADAPPSGLPGIFKLLADDTRPFVGTPRACDLYWLHSIIEETVARALSLVSDDEWEETLNVLARVSDETSTTLMGELGGPLARDVLLGLICRFTNPSRSRISRGVLEETLNGHGRFRFYSDLAGFELAAARLALVDRDRDRATGHWDRAARLLVGYGWRKDITIYDLLDSIPALSALDLEEARKRLSDVQPLSIRVVNHTDGAETRHAPARWWELLAADDPEAAGWTVLRELTRWPNVPQRTLEGVRSDLWRSHHAEADPLVAAALLLTLGQTSIGHDAKLIERLADSTSGGPEGLKTRLSEWLLARWDERVPIDEIQWNGGDLPNDADVHELNRVAELVGAHPISLPIHPLRAESSPSRSWSALLSDTLSDETLIDFGPGALGLARGVREWSRQPFGRHGSRWDVDRLVSAVGFRLIELEAAGRRDEAEAILRATADALRLGDERRVIASLAEGLELRGCVELAVVAYVLAFTRSRGGGGWLSFGGPEHVASLDRAWMIDSVKAAEVLADEIGRVIRGPGYGTYGVSRSLIQAFAALSDRVDPPGAAGIATAFGLWDASFDVISSRLPPGDSRDGPDVVYEPSDRLAGVGAPIEPGAEGRFVFGPDPMPGGFDGSVDAALVAATLAALAHPGREQKRHALLALVALLRARPELLGPALSVTLPRLDVPTLTWVLSVILNEEAGAASVITTAAEPLRSLARSDFLTVRALARRLLETVGSDPGPVPPGRTVEGLFEEATRARAPLWAPHDPDAPETEPRGESRYEGSSGQARLLRDATSAVDDVCGARIQRVSDELPGLSDAVVRGFTERVRSGEVGERIDAQYEDLVSRAEPHTPDAVTADEEVAEETLQSVAGGARTALATTGVVLPDPGAWDAELATALCDDPLMPLSLEAARVPRPRFALPPTAAEHGWIAAPREAVDLDEFDPGEVQFLIHPSGPVDPPVLSRGPLAGWHVLGMTERLEMSSRGGRGTPSTRSVRRAAYEVRAGVDGPRDQIPPLGFGNGAVFSRPAFGRRGRVSLTHTQPIVGEDRGDDSGGIVTESALGLAAPLLTPTRAVVSVLGLVPSEDPYELALYDEAGRALVVRTWRAGYGSGEYELPRPGLWGTDIVLRGDLFARLTEAAGPLIWREHAMLVQR